MFGLMFVFHVVLWFLAEDCCFGMRWVCGGGWGVEGGGVLPYV